MRLTVVGSGTAVPEVGRACSGYFVETGATRLLLDCGPGVVHHLARFDLPWDRVDHVLVSHFHTDHIGDVPMLLFALKWGTPAPRSRPLTLWGPVGLEDRLRHMAAAFGDHVTDPGFPVEIRELAPGQGSEAGDVRFATVKTPHTDESVGYRLERDGQVLGYTGDTGFSDHVARFLAGAGTLIAECSLPDDEAIDIHLTPSRLAAMATTAAPGRLVVTHVYPRLDRQDVVTRVREAGFDGHAVRAEDGRAWAVSPPGSTHPDPMTRPR